MKSFIIFLFICYLPFLYAKEKLVESTHGAQFLVMDHWKKKSANFYHGLDGTSIHIQSEENIMDLDAYVKRIEEKFIASYHDYKTISKTYEVIANHTAIVLKGHFSIQSNFHKIEMQATLFIFNFYGEKLIFIATYPSSIHQKALAYLEQLKQKIKLPQKTKKTKSKVLGKEQLKLFKNKEAGYQLLIPENFLENKKGVWFSEDSQFILIDQEEIQESLNIYLKKYVKKIKKAYKKISILQEEHLRINGFEVIELKIKKENKKLFLTFYKKNNTLYILTLSEKNPYIEHIKKSFNKIK